MTKHYDLISIGAGSGGLSAAERAAKYGKKCAIIEPGALGGTCVNVGCVPKKVMWYAANLAHDLKTAAGYGFSLEKTAFDWNHLVKARNLFVSNINNWYYTFLEDSNIDLIDGTGRFVDAHTVEVEGELYTADHIVVATGGEPTIPNIPGAELGITSDGFFELMEQPKSVAIIGSGYIAVELAGVLNALGTDVTLILRGEHLLRPFDAMLRETLMEQMVNDGITLASSSQIDSLSQTDDGLINITCRTGNHQQGFDKVIWAVGRTPKLQELNLAATKIELDDAGFVKIDEFQNTAEPGVYAVGDITDRPPLTPVAIAAARRLSDRLFNHQSDRKLETNIVPTVVFTHPPIATIGLTEDEARAGHGSAVKIYSSRFTPMFHTFEPDGQHQTAMKLVTVGAQEKIIGCHVIGIGADEMIQGFAVAMRMGATKKDFDDTIAVHPSSAEEFVTMR
ncbi:MAG: glutathione-disulfide reductase [Methylococcales bacterium]|jgi:glutathione reductase (NADPH)|nr:glutathione-disulfide reductase [Methylococcales bacterium]